tara:strand:- start:462 stop:1340 length:879 start_codon:yes stop_codon:yes gene_type:complete
MKFFICPGAQKAGTTKLYNLLKFHPEINLSEIKESKYFLKHIKDISKEKFLEFFSNSDSQLHGEIDPEYIYYEDTSQKIKETLGKDVKFIFMLRNPVDRAYSHYWMSFRRGFELLNFDDAIKAEKERLENKEKHAIWHYSYLDRGFYFKQIENYLKVFDLDQMHFVIFEEFVSNMQIELNKIYDFLDITPHDITEEIINEKSNEGNYPKSEFLRKLHGQPSRLKSILKVLIPFKKLRWWIYPIIEKFNSGSKKYEKIDPKLKQELLTSFFLEDIKNLQKLTGKDLENIWINN